MQKVRIYSGVFRTWLGCLFKWKSNQVGNRDRDRLTQQRADVPPVMVQTSGQRAQLWHTVPPQDGDNRIEQQDQRHHGDEVRPEEAGPAEQSNEGSYDEHPQRRQEQKRKQEQE